MCIARGGYLCSFVGADGYRDGYVCRMLPTDSEACPHFTPTRLELWELTYHWLVQYLDVHLYMFHSGVAGTTEGYIAEYSSSRLKLLQKQLGEDVYSTIHADVERAFLERFGELWTDFCKASHTANR